MTLHPTPLAQPLAKSNMLSQPTTVISAPRNVSEVNFTLPVTQDVLSPLARVSRPAQLFTLMVPCDSASVN